MNRQETTQIITLLAGNYINISEKTKEQKQLMIKYMARVFRRFRL